MSKRQRLHTRSIISLPVPVEDGKRIVRAARAIGQPVAAFCREAALASANRVLAKIEKEAAQPTAAA
jgi:uncharacterized protein (DUF1778 family)